MTTHSPEEHTLERARSALRGARFILLRYETEYTPCAGITAVVRQERRHFPDGVVVAPWCPRMAEAQSALVSGRVQETGWAVGAEGGLRVLVTADQGAPMLFLAAQGHFLGVEDPYDTPALKDDALVFGLVVRALLKEILSPGPLPAPCILGADWQTVPALLLLHRSHHTVLTLHNTFDDCLAEQAIRYGTTYAPLRERRASNGLKTTLEVGMEIADVVTTVNRGFAHGMCQEPLQQQIMAAHLRPHLHRVVGIDNGPFRPLPPALLDLEERLRLDPASGISKLRCLKAEARARLPEALQLKARDKVLIVTMGRRVAQKQHDVLVEAIRFLLREHPDLPLLVFFATVHGDAGSDLRQRRILALADEFPDHVLHSDGQLPYFADLLEAADYNCMPSLFEPHGGAYGGTVVPIARAVDGLNEQVCGLHPTGEAARFNGVWHAPSAHPSGLLFREETPDAAVDDLRALLTESPSPANRVFRAMVQALNPVLRQAVDLRLTDFEGYARLVAGALAKQREQSWEANRQAIIALVEQARSRRRVA